MEEVIVREGGIGLRVCGQKNWKQGILEEGRLKVINFLERLDLKIDRKDIGV